MAGSSRIFIFEMFRPPRARIGINGSGLISRLLIRCSVNDPRGLDVVAVNAPGITPELFSYLIKHDTNYGPCPGVVSNKVEMLKPENPNGSVCLFIEVCGRKIAFFSHTDTSDIPWDWQNVEYVIETNPTLTRLAAAEQHLKGGRARKVIVTADTCDIPVVLYPIGYKSYQRGTSIISTGSPNSLALGSLVYLLDQQFGIKECIATLTTSFNASEKIVDGPNSLHWRLGRGAFQSIIPMSLQPTLNTLLQAMPLLRGKINVVGFTVPSASGNVVDLTCELITPVGSVEDLVCKLREGPVLAQLERVHEKCQPGWLLKHWCPEEMDNIVEQLPKIDCSLKPNDKQKKFHIPRSDGGPDDGAYDSADISKKTNSNHKISPNFFEAQAKAVCTPVIEIWDRTQLGVASDVRGTKSMLTLDPDSSLKLKDGFLFKIISWYDKDLSFCLRIMDTLVFMRNMDHG